MAFGKIITADERLSQRPKINVAIFGTAGAGKTTQARTLDPHSTAFLDLEAGTLALGNWSGDVVALRTWDEMTMVASILHGPDPARRPDQKYSQAYYDHACEQAGHDFVAHLKSKATVFTDSITVAGRLALQWAKGQPEAFNAQGKADTRGAYGLLGGEIVDWITHLQHIPDKSVVIVGGLEEKTDEYGRKTYLPLIEGSKAGKELPYIFDEVFTLTSLTDDNGQKYRAFICHQINEWGFPAKDRSGALNLVEEPNLGKLLDKISKGVRQDTMVTTIPAAA